MHKFLVEMVISECDIGSTHDVIFDAFGVSHTDEEILKLIAELPPAIKGEIITWGAGDTCVRGSIFEYIKKESNFMRDSLRVQVYGYDLDDSTIPTTLYGVMSFKECVDYGISPDVIVDQDLEVFLPIEEAMTLAGVIKCTE